MGHAFTANSQEAHRIFVVTARDLAAHGIAVLRFDCPGSDNSAGEFQEVTVSGEILDAAAALDCLASRPEVAVPVSHAWDFRDALGGSATVRVIAGA